MPAVSAAAAITMSPSARHLIVTTISSSRRQVQLLEKDAARCGGSESPIGCHEHGVLSLGQREVVRVVCAQLRPDGQRERKPAKSSTIPSLEREGDHFGQRTGGLLGRKSSQADLLDEAVR